MLKDIFPVSPETAGRIPGFYPQHNPGNKISGSAHQPPEKAPILRSSASVVAGAHSGIRSFFHGINQDRKRLWIVGKVCIHGRDYFPSAEGKALPVGRTQTGFFTSFYKSYSSVFKGKILHKFRRSVGRIVVNKNNLVVSSFKCLFQTRNQCGDILLLVVSGDNNRNHQYDHCLRWRYFLISDMNSSTFEMSFFIRYILSAESS